MMFTKRSKIVYTLIIVAWILMLLWQILEHRRVEQAAREALLGRTQDISHSVGVAIRSHGRSFVSQTRLEKAIRELVKSRELKAVALINTAGDVVASAGDPIDASLEDLMKTGTKWTTDYVVTMNLVDLGGRSRDDFTTRPAPIVIKHPPPPPEEFLTSMTKMLSRAGKDKSFWDRMKKRPRRFGRPPWLSEEEYRKLLDKQGLHGFFLKMSTDAYRAEISRDWWLRCAVVLIALLAALGIAAAWRSLERTEALKLRLLRAREQNEHLRELNLAAAGLAHETRNPLNLVRGQAQMIVKNKAVPGETREKAGAIIEEVDRITNRLGEFINYSKPLTPRMTPMNLKSVIHDVERTLLEDIEEKSIDFRIEGPDLHIRADESLLRQVIFNLLLNAVQAVDRNGTIEVVLEGNKRGEAAITVRDNGPGIPTENRSEIFRPYFTTREKGSGLGLAVVLQIVLVHQWEVDYTPGENKGSSFRVKGIQIIDKDFESA